MTRRSHLRRFVPVLVTALGIVAAVASTTSGSASDGPYLNTSGVSGAARMGGIPLAARTQETDAYVANVTLACSSRQKCEGFRLEVKNKTEQPLEVLWDKTQYIEGDTTRGTFTFEGIRYMEKEAPKPPAIVIPSGSMTKEIIPAVSIHFQPGKYGGWRVAELPSKGDTVGVFLTVKHGERELNSTFRFRMQWIGPNDDDSKVPGEPAPDAGVQQEMVDGGAADDAGEPFAA